MKSFLVKTFFPLATKGIHAMNFTQIYERNILPDIMPLAKSLVFTTPEMFIRAKLQGLRVKTISAEYQPRIQGKGVFGKPHDIICFLYDMLRFRLKSLIN